MNKFRIVITSLLMIFFAFNVSAQVKKQPVKKQPVTKTTKVTFKAPVIKKIPGVRLKITTDSGVIVVRLYDKTPKHRDNYIKLANEHFFDSLLFHRVIQGFMIQGGDPQSKNSPPGVPLGMGDVGYTIPAEFDTSLFHKKGALAAARTENPEKASSGCQFYIVQGKPLSDLEISGIEMQTGIRFSPAKRKIYTTIGGTPFLDTKYTVFGEVETGLGVIDKIAAVPTGDGNRPIGDVHMYIQVMK